MLKLCLSVNFTSLIVNIPFLIFKAIMIKYYEMRKYLILGAVIILRFNGYIWKVQKITITYENLIDLRT